MPVFRIGNTSIRYRLEQRAGIKRRYIRVNPNEVLVTAHADDTPQDVYAFLQRKERWLFNNARQVASAKVKEYTIPKLASGVKIPYRGRHVKLKIMNYDGNSVDIRYRNGINVLFPASLGNSDRTNVISDALRLWMKERLRRDVADIVKRLSAATGLKPHGIRVKDQKTMWGSCTKQGVVNLNWQLIFAPRSVLEYAIAHEMSHLRYRSHGPSFWRFLKSISPNYERAKRWLEKNEHMLGYTLLIN